MEADAGKNNSQIARQLGLGVETVRIWRKRWLTLQGVALADLSVRERLNDVPRPGRRSQINAEQTCQLIAIELLLADVAQPFQAPPETFRHIGSSFAPKKAQLTPLSLAQIP